MTHQALSAQLELVKTIDRSIREEDYELMLDAIDESYSQKKKFSPMTSAGIDFLKTSNPQTRISHLESLSQGEKREA